MNPTKILKTLNKTIGKKNVEQIMALAAENPEIASAALSSGKDLFDKAKNVFSPRSSVSAASLTPTTPGSAATAYSPISIPSPGVKLTPPTPTPGYNPITSLFSSGPDTSVLSAPKVSTPAGPNDQLFTYGTIITVIVGVWALVSILYNVYQRDEKKKRDFNSIHNVLFGGTGVIPSLVIIWGLLMLVLMIIQTLDSVVNIGPSLIDRLTSNLKDTFNIFKR